MKYNDSNGPTNKENNMARTKPYRFRSFVFDVIMTIITSGFWLIWVFVREMRNAR